MILITIFTRRGGSIVFLGFMSIAIAIGLAGYQSILADTFLGGLLDSASDGGGLDFTGAYQTMII